jgi:hypothetical protein
MALSRFGVLSLTSPTVLAPRPVWGPPLRVLGENPRLGAVGWEGENSAQVNTTPSAIGTCIHCKSQEAT